MAKREEDSSEVAAALRKVAHNVRSSLSIVSGVLEDMGRGLPVEAEDIEASARAVKRVLEEISALDTLAKK